MKTFGLIGFPLNHSFSEKYFSEKFKREKINDCEYKLFPIQRIDELPGLIKSIPDLSGLNVTLPYKQAVFPFINEMDPLAKNIGAVNTIKIIRTPYKYLLKGYNTDAFAFQESIKPLLKPYHKAALILGNGGAAKAIQRALVYGLGIDHIMFVSRKSSTSARSNILTSIKKQLIITSLLLIQLRSECILKLKPSLLFHIIF